MRRFFSSSVLVGTLLLSFGLVGCAVPQPAGDGRVQRLIESRTKTGYWLYLPDDYVRKDGQRDDGRRWPLVVSFHGMKPFDNAQAQCREWQAEADRYGFVVIAPELRTCDLFMEFPLKDPDLPYVQRDEKAVLGMMDEVFRRTNADPTRVLATSWSSGGYMAHYLVNKYPERFTVLAVRQSNFSGPLLNSAQIAKYRNMKIGIFFAENDLPVCRRESMDAVAFYRQHRFPVDAKFVSGMGHERTPQTAAAYFASAIGASPKSPPPLNLVLNDISPEQLGDAQQRLTQRSELPTSPRTPLVASPQTTTRRLPGAQDQTQASASSSPLFNAPPTPKRNLGQQPALTPPSRGDSATVRPSAKPPYLQPYITMPSPAPRSEERPRQTEFPDREPPKPKDVKGRIKVEGETVGAAPLWVVATAEIPPALADGASILWIVNGEPFASSDFTAQVLLRDAGDHDIQARIITVEDERILLKTTVSVLPQAEASTSTTQPAGA